MSAPRLFIERIVEVEERVPENFWDRFNFVLEDLESPPEPEKVPLNPPRPVPELIPNGRSSPDSFHSAETISLREYFRSYCPAESSEDLGKFFFEVLFI